MAASRFSVLLAFEVLVNLIVRSIGDHFGGSLSSFRSLSSRPIDEFILFLGGGRHLDLAGSSCLWCCFISTEALCLQF